jgi:murein DD-endopeptidase MepM/ murein hydrolase activator NlpD
MKIRQIRSKIIILTLAIVFLFSINYLKAQEQSVDELNAQIEEKKAEIDKLKESVKVYEQNIQVAQAQTVTLKNQLSILDGQIYKNNLQLEITEKQLAKLNLEIKKTADNIAKTTEKVNQNNKNLGEYLRQVNLYDQEDFLTVLITNDSFSDFFDQVNYLEDIQEQIKQLLFELKKEKKELEENYVVLNNKKDELDTFEKKLAQQKDRLLESRKAKDKLLIETKSSEKTFKSMISKLRLEQDEINNSIISLEVSVRQKLRAQEEKNRPLDIDKEAQLSWPVNPARGISAYFHDPEYPFRHIFEHPAIDVRASQGTSIRSAESGVVLKARDAGYGYSYVMIIHGGGISTVYGHLSRIDVAQDEYVVKGQVIGAVGGMPGTRGAGLLTTGPHLHFEVRKEGIPVNPIEYLP